MAESHFPSDSVQALAFLWVQNQDLTGKTPAELYDLYHDALEQVKARMKERKENR